MVFTYKLHYEFTSATRLALSLPHYRTRTVIFLYLRKFPCDLYTAMVEHRYYSNNSILGNILGKVSTYLIGHFAEPLDHGNENMSKAGVKK